MATYTSKYHLEKPDQTDIYNIDVHNANSDAIDAALAAKPDSSNLATVESTNKASRAYTVGEYLVYNGLLYRVSAAIASGGTLTPGTNLTATTTGAQLKSLNDSLTTVSSRSMNATHTAFAESWSINDLITAGVYRYTVLPSNAPTWMTSAYGMVLVFVAQNYVLQIVTVGGFATIYARFRNTNANTWYEKKLD